MRRELIIFRNLLFYILLTGELLHGQSMGKSQYLYGKKVPSIAAENLVGLSLCSEDQFIQIMESHKMGDRIYDRGLLSFCYDGLATIGFDDEGNLTMGEICYKLDEPGNIVQVSYMFMGSKKKFILDDLIKDLKPYYTGRAENGSNIYTVKISLEQAANPIYAQFIVARETSSNAIIESVTVKVRSE